MNRFKYLVIWNTLKSDAKGLERVARVWRREGRTPDIPSNYLPACTFGNSATESMYVLGLVDEKAVAQIVSVRVGLPTFAFTEDFLPTRSYSDFLFQPWPNPYTKQDNENCH